MLQSQFNKGYPLQTEQNLNIRFDFKKWLYIIPILFLLACSDDILEPQKFESVDVNIRMEVQILDSAYQLYARPFTRIYFTT